jgi:hypothetical protein
MPTGKTYEYDPDDFGRYYTKAEQKNTDRTNRQFNRMRNLENSVKSLSGVKPARRLKDGY